MAQDLSKLIKSDREAEDHFANAAQRAVQAAADLAEAMAEHDRFSGRLQQDQTDVAALEKKLEAASKILDKVEADLPKAKGDRTKRERDLKQAIKTFFGGQQEELRVELDAARKAVVADTKELETLKRTLEELKRAEQQHETAKNKRAIERQEARAAMDRALLDHPRIVFDGEVLRLLSGRAKTAPDDFLTIKNRDVAFASVVRDALEEFASDAESQSKHDALRDALVESGVATNIEKVTQRINRQRLSPIRRAVLARVYPDLLRHRLAHNGGALNEEQTKDTSGLAQTVLADLEMAHGKLDEFAKVLAGRTAAAFALDAPAGSTQRAVLEARIRGGL
jgi:hypothetical protein